MSVTKSQSLVNEGESSVLAIEDRKKIYSVLTFFKKLSLEEQASILKHVKKITYQQNETIHSGQHSCEGILIVKSGFLRAYLLSDEGKEVSLYRLEENDLCVLSASCALNNITFDVHVDAQVESEVLIVDLKSIHNVQKYLHVENFLLAETVTRFSDVMWTMDKILFLKLDQRLGHFLLDEIERTKNKTVFQTHEQLAQHLGSAREVVSRMLQYFSREGIVSVSRGAIEVTDVEALKQLSY